MSEATLTMPRARRFFPLHLKFMLSYLVLASAIMAVSLGFAWRESHDAAQREQSVALESSYRDLRLEFDRRQERALAVLNLAAASPQLVRQIMAGGQVGLGPDEVGGGGYGAVASYVSGPEALPQSLATAAGAAKTATGAAMVDGRPQAVAVSPIAQGEGSTGYIMVSVELSDIKSSTGAAGTFALLTETGGLTALGVPADVGTTNLSYSQVSDLQAGRPVTGNTANGDATDVTVYLPLPSPASSPVIVMVAQVAAAGGSGANTLLGLAVLTFAIGLFVAHFLARTMSRPVELVTEATERVAGGDIAYQMPFQKGRDELAMLTQSFNHMTQKYCASQAEVEEGARRLEREVVRQDLEIQALFGISRAITSILDVKYLLENVLSLSMPLVDGVAGAVWLDGNPVSSRQPAFGRVISAGGGATEAFPVELPTGHPLLGELSRVGWRVSALLPAGPDGQGASRQLFFRRKGESGQEAPFVAEEHEFRQGLCLSAETAGDPDAGDWDSAASEVTEVAVPIFGQQGFCRGLLAIGIAGRRRLSEHEALLLFNIAGLASVAVENAGLYDLAQKRGRQIETLLRESQHRITNNLAAVSGMLSVQLARTTTEETSSIIRDNIARIGSIAEVHRLLAGELRDEVELARLISTICEPTIAGSASQIILNINGPALLLPARQAVPVALVVNELATNSVKHGFRGRERGLIDVAIAREGDMLLIDYGDDGAGMRGPAAPATVAAAASGRGFAHIGLGTQIINSLVTGDLGGEISTLPGNGYRVRIAFPLAAGGPQSDSAAEPRTGGPQSDSTAEPRTGGNVSHG